MNHSHSLPTPHTHLCSSSGSKESTAVLFNRAKVVTLLHGANTIGASLAVGTVLDGT